MTPGGVLSILGAVPAYWYGLAVLLVVTPTYFLLTRPRKKKHTSKWKG